MPIAQPELTTSLKGAGDAGLMTGRQGVILPAPPDVPADLYYNGTIALGPVAYWRLGEAPLATVAVDAIGVLNVDGTYINTPALGATGIPGVPVDTAVSFDRASGEYVTDCGDTTDFAFIQNTGVFSIELWVKLDSFPGRQFFIANTDLGSATTKGVAIWLFEGNNSVAVTVTRQVSGDYVYNFASSANAINDTTTWHQVLITSDGANGMIYVDAVPVGAAAIGSLSSGDSTSNLNLAADSSGITNNLSGTADEVTIYDYALTPAQVLSQYNNGSVAP